MPQATLINPTPKVANLVQLLYRAAESSAGITLYDDGEERTSKYVTYQELLRVASIKARQLESVPHAQRVNVVFLHFGSFQDSVEWFWAVVLAGLLPVVSTPLPIDQDRRLSHLKHVRDMLQQPVILTSDDLLDDFRDVDNIDLHSVDHFQTCQDEEDWKPAGRDRSPLDQAALMLTSGSSGNAKAVVLRHEQIVASVEGKSTFFETTATDIFLNWIGFDHVASVIETHMHALYLGAELVHVPATTVIADPLEFLRLVELHRVAYTFAPHFFLARLLLNIGSSADLQVKFDLSCLKHLISGGESNIVETAVALTETLQEHGLRLDFIRPGFGMTETCAGCIYSKSCPSYDSKKGNIFASLGVPVPGISMRIADATGCEVTCGNIGDLQVNGKLVCREYFNNPTATAASYTTDGWFITGDRAYIDSNGNLNIAGREKESINLNGVKYFPNELETALENAHIVGLTSSYTVVFSYRPPKSQGEELCVVYHPTFDHKDIAKRVETASRIAFVVGMCTTCRPRHIIPLPKIFLQKSALGKISRAKIKASFEDNLYAQYEDSKDVNIKKFKVARREDPATSAETTILNVVRDIVNVPEEELDVNNSIFDLGITSTDLFTLKRLLEKDLALIHPLPVGLLLTTPTIRGIASEVERLDQNHSAPYDPVVPLRSNPASGKTPLWLVHPGSGDVLVFVALAKHLSDRTVYGLRTRGLNTSINDSNYFTSIADIADCYVKNMILHQPHGPYAIAGYSLGSTVAFEIAKRLDVRGHRVAFLGMLDSPPHMKGLIEHLGWNDVLLNVAYFLELIGEELSIGIDADLHNLSPEQALDYIITSAPKERLRTLAIDKERLKKLTDVTNAFGQAGRVYDPEGMVQAMDVFWVTPLLSVATSRREWMDKHLSLWRDFSETPPRFHECEGVHSKMLNLDHIASFQQRLKSAIAARDI
jgi:acyl-CoA synthetase (AMP-forming)/AMP-acid ligase II/thioesterase domain-containing protein